MALTALRRPSAFFVFEAKHEHRGRHRSFGVGLQLRHVVLAPPRRPILRLAHQHQLTFRHHGKAPGRLQYLVHIGVAAVDHGLVEIAHRLLDDVGFERLGNLVYEVGFLAMQEVDRLQ